MKKICIFSAQYYPHIGGVEQYVDNFARALVSLGNEVTIVTTLMKETQIEEERDGIKIYRLPSFLFMNGRFPFLKFSKERRRIENILKEMSFDVILVNMRFYQISLYAVQFAKRNKIRCIMLDHGTSHLNTGGKITSKIGEWYEHVLTALEKKFVKEFAGVSNATLDWIKHFGIESDLVLYNSIDVEEFEELKENLSKDYRKELSIPKEAIVISFVGRLTIEKGIEELIIAIRKIQQKRDDVWLLVAGEGYLRDKIENAKDTHIRFLGKLNKPDIVSMLMASDIFCLPSVSEGFPTTVLEASICGNYVISTYRGGTRELIQNMDYGLILSDNHPDRLYEGIINVLDKEEYREAASEKCYNEIVAKYTWKFTAQKFIDYIK